MNKIQALKNWFLGFFKREYTYELPEEPVYDTVALLAKMGEKFSPIMSAISELPVTNVRFGIHDYTIEKIQNTNLKEKLSTMDTCISFVKASVQTIRSCGQKEIEVLLTVFCLGIDNEVWKFEFKPYFLYDSRNSEFDNRFIQLCVELASNCIESLDLHIITKQDLTINDIWSLETLGERCFDGKVSTFGLYPESQIYGINEILPNPLENEAKLYQNAIHKFPVDDTMKEESLIFDVVRRKKKPTYVPDEMKHAMEEFDLHVLGKSTVGELISMTHEIINNANKGE